MDQIIAGVYARKANTVKDKFEYRILRQAQDSILSMSKDRNTKKTDYKCPKKVIG